MYSYLPIFGKPKLICICTCEKNFSVYIHLCICHKCQPKYLFICIFQKISIIMYFYLGLKIVFVTHCWTALYCTALHCTALHCTALKCNALKCTALHCLGGLGQVRLGGLPVLPLRPLHRSSALEVQCIVQCINSVQYSSLTVYSTVH